MFTKAHHQILKLNETKSHSYIIFRSFLALLQAGFAYCGTGTKVRPGRPWVRIGTINTAEQFRAHVCLIEKKMLSTWGRLLSEFKLPQNAQPFKVQWSIYTTKINIQKYYVPPHCGYVSFVGISEQITIISIHVVDSAVFTTKAECLLHAQTHFKFIFVRKVFKSVDPQRDPTRSHEIAEKRGVSKWQWMALYRQRKGQHCIYTKTWDSWRLVIYTSKTWSIWFCSQDLICCRESHSINKNFQLFQKLLCCLQQFITQPRPRVSLSTRFNL